MIIDYFHVEGVAISKLETKAPPPIDRHRPLASPAALQLVQSHAPHIAELGQVRSSVQCRQQFLGCGDIQSAEPRNLAKFVKSACR